MLIFVFLSLVSCHLGFLTIVSVLHILLLQLALSTEREKSGTGRGTGLKKLLNTHDMGASFRTAETDREGMRTGETKGERGRNAAETYSVKGHRVLFPYNSFLHRCTLQHKT